MAVEPAYAGSPEFVPEWDVYRDTDGNAVTVACWYGYYAGPPLTHEQLLAVRHAVEIWKLVCAAEGNTFQQTDTTNPDGTTAWKKPNVAKSRLLERMIHYGLPPTRTKPPIDMGGPAWWLLPGGDPFAS